MADDNIDQRLAAIEAALPALATKADLEGIARNVDIQALQRHLERQTRSLATKRDLRELEQRLTIRLGSIMVTVATVLFAALHYIPSAHGAEAQQEPPYSCRLLYDEQRKCIFDPHCDKRVLDRLARECLRDGGRP